MRSIFVSTSHALGKSDSPLGGVQICTLEYLEVLRHAGFDVLLFEFDVDRRVSNRIDKRIRRRPYHNVLPPDLSGRVLNAISESDAQVVFLNIVDLAPLAQPIRERFGARVKVIVLSHGLGCADLLHEIRVRDLGRSGNKPSSRDLRWLAGHIIAECDQRKYIDHVFCLSDFDVGLERWVGARSVSWLPRVVLYRPLDWKPVAGRIGFVGTLDHPPNAEGLELFLQSLEKYASQDLRVRVVGGPQRAGVTLSKRYRSVDYIGHCDDDKLQVEASTWSCAIHPLFCYSRGCSTKLATLLGWGLPIVTTLPGCRGYVWREGTLPQAETPEAFAELVKQVITHGERERVRTEISRISASSPKIAEVAKLAREQLASVFRH